MKYSLSPAATAMLSRFVVTPTPSVPAITCGPPLVGHTCVAEPPVILTIDPVTPLPPLTPLPVSDLSRRPRMLTVPL